GHKTIEASLDINRFAPYALGLINKYEGYALSAATNAKFEFDNIDDLTGSLSISDISFADGNPSTTDINLEYLTLETFPTLDSPGLLLTSDIVNAYINGPYQLSTIKDDFNDIVASVFPALYSDNRTTDSSRERINNFVYNIKIGACQQLCQFLNLPMAVIYPIDISGHFSAEHQAATLAVAAPYIRQGNSIIENTSLTADIDAVTNQSNVKFDIKFPTKKGNLSLTASISGSNNRLNNNIDWLIDRKIPINGAFNFSALFSRDLNNQLATTVAFNPGTLTFGNDIWSINPSWISIEPKRYVIDNFILASENKSIDINGIVSTEEDDAIEIALSNITLLDIFETLEIEKALIGGRATGTFHGHGLLTENPELYCNNLHVDSISYNRCTLGDADIVAFWDNEKRSFNLNAKVDGLTGHTSHVYGDIFPVGEALDINFDVHHVPIGFMKPFMSAFASDLKGHASGKARLFGTFKYIDMEGDVFADDLNIKIDFTNTWYSASDTIRLRPGLIDIDDIIIYDENGHTAMLNGVVHHTFFKEPTFNFAVTDARDFLCYNVNSHQSPVWYGTIYGNGRASISGEPGVVNIGVNMSTAPKSIFNFVLSDRLDAGEFSFITFTDRRAKAMRDSIMAADNIPTVVRELRDQLSSDNNDSPSAYNMDLQMSITPDARMVLIMDPVGGDEIKANGSGNLRLTYESVNNDLKMYGTYTLNRGSYNFTLQDIIIKDFTIKEGSTIAFHGDPYSAQLNIQASYGVNANLSDLDETFLKDKDLNRTNVPVHALLKVTGDMRQPDIDFDLEFPTLTQDTYRKVRSIVSTKEMMNRQIIYLLALNRFYTPDYMASTTKGNELFSVASSTISSQLSSILGKLSEDWSIAPNLRSDRGDFSDVEVDVALSSRLLNNRLLFNGNFGYRDKTLNTNQFIGDFDIEYLLNPKGSWRLKAYNRYNDQNYFVRTAQTTQGVGLVFKKDFDKFFGFLRPKPRKLTDIAPAQSDSTSIVLPDSIAHPANPLLNQ
nr:translocation/assembly module TamB [Muribaculaceae bacterium]